ncbi:MAG: hypothetical protein Q4Q18_01845, partial [Methanobrevibacter sp.]|nr:hypothetical protein [Methanobrevibacter sp.]
MKLKHLMIVSLILAILAIGAVSAADDVDALAVDDEGVAVEESSLDDVVEADESSDTLGDPAPEDFNVTIINKEFDIDKDADSAVITFQWPADVPTDVDNQGWIKADYGIYDCQIFINEGITNFTLGDFWMIEEPGNYNLTISYGVEFNELFNITTG